MGATKKNGSSAVAPVAPDQLSKKEQVVSLYLGGIREVADLALLTKSRPSYVAGVLQDAGLKADYHDLYTTTDQPMNVYSKFFAGKLGFKDEETAREGVELIDRLYQQFEFAGDRAGQHHALVMALTMFDRARWTGKRTEADVYRLWLVARLTDPMPEPPPAKSPKAKAKKKPPPK